MTGTVTDPAFNPSRNEHVEIIKHQFASMEAIVREHCPDGRRRALALTYLETSAMFAVKSVFEP